MAEKEKIVYIELNNWAEGIDYPCCEPVISWMAEEQFADGSWCKQNRLCVLGGCVDMSSNYCIAAPEEWVRCNCPELLTNDTYMYAACYGAEASQIGSFSDFRREPDSDGNVFSRFGWKFLPYCEKNFGVTWQDDLEQG